MVIVARARWGASTLLAVVLLAGCGGGDPAPRSGAGSDTPESSSAGVGSQRYPDILEVQVDRADDRTASLQVTVSSPYDTPQRYADGWRVLDQDGEVLGEHTLTHGHPSEQPFTRSQSGVQVPEGTTELTIEGRDQQNGYGGETVTVDW